jgi:hypothetical protein
MGDLDDDFAFTFHGNFATARLIANVEMSIALPTVGVWHSIIHLSSDSGAWELAVVGNVLRRVGSVSMAPALGQIIEIVITATPTRATYSAVVLE